MTRQTKIGGVNREALLRLWFLFYVWAGIDGYFTPYQPWQWFAWLAGSGLTCLLLYRRSDLAGIVGYVVAATAAVMTLPDSVSSTKALLEGRFTYVDGSFFPPSFFLHAFRDVALAFVPTVILAMHVASRHRLQRSFEGSEARRRHGRIVPPGAYYFVTLR